MEEEFFEITFDPPREGIHYYYQPRAEWLSWHGKEIGGCTSISDYRAYLELYREDILRKYPERADAVSETWIDDCVKWLEGQERIKVKIPKWARQYRDIYQCGN